MPIVELVAFALGILGLGYGVISSTKNKNIPHIEARLKLDKIKTYLAELQEELEALGEMDRSGPYHLDNVAPELKVVAFKS
ncbi:hypothetical protein BC835DRAFT_1335771 [Cytidiella melzeri]|nr:hypothetical protein BC835DRAFT_1335771 [Cytidiella melzeri]